MKEVRHLIATLQHLVVRNRYRRKGIILSTYYDYNLDETNVASKHETHAGEATTTIGSHSTAIDLLQFPTQYTGKVGCLVAHHRLLGGRKRLELLESNQSKGFRKVKDHSHNSIVGKGIERACSSEVLFVGVVRIESCSCQERTERT